MKFLLLGDVHANFTSLQWFQKEALKQFPDLDGAIQVGDFGFYPSVIGSPKRLGNENIKFLLPTYVIDGNHEDHSWLNTTAKTKGLWECWRSWHNLFYTPRGVINNFGDSTFAFIGGAMNVDRKQSGHLHLGTNNYLAFEEVYTYADKINKYGGVDVLVTHSNPCSIGLGIEGNPIWADNIKKLICKPFNLPEIPLDDCGDHSHCLLYNLLDKKPKFWFFGHHHATIHKVVNDTEFIGVDTTHANYDYDKIYPFVYDTEMKDYIVGKKIQRIT
jgi:hypothetical protein